MKGVHTALVTPFTAKDEIDLEAYRRILRDQREAGISGVVPCGTTGEAPTLSTDEKKLLIQTAIDELKGSGVRVIAGTGSNSTSDTVKFSKWASDAGADAILVVTPYYNKPSQTGLADHFRAVADSVSCEVILYNVPGRTAVSLTASTVADLAAHSRIRSIKEATGNVAFTSEIVEALHLSKHAMDILSGDDATYLPALAVGAVGVISVASNLFPRGMVAIQKAAENGRFEEARAIHDRFFPLFRDLFVESNPVPVKHALAALGICGARVRPPLAPLGKESAEKLMASVARCGLKKGTPA